MAHVSFDEACAPLREAEQALVDSARSEERRLELRAGRTAARRAFEAAGVVPAPAVLPDDFGRPVADVPGWHLSLAHDARTAFAAVARRPVGVDVIDRAREADVVRVVKRRLASGRAKPLAGHPLPGVEAALLLWSAWEALGKRSGGGILSGPMMLDIAPVAADEGAVADVDGGRVRWFLDGPILVCLASSESP